jgi:membrane-associated phospholipid phosphatase
MRSTARLGAAVLLASVTAARARAAPAPADPEAVYRVNPAVDGPIIVAGALGGLIPYALTSDLIHQSCPCDAASVNGFDRGVIGNSSDVADALSTATVALAIVGPAAADWAALRSKRVWLADTVVFAESLSVNTGLVTLAKYAVQRPIPRAYTDPSRVNDPGSYRSFYSGHVSTLFAALSTASVTLNARYGLTWQPWAVTLLAGASVAAERVLAGYHFYTDVLVGAAAGTVVGTAVSVLHLRAPGLRLSFFRPAAGEGAGLALSGAI